MNRPYASPGRQRARWLWLLPPLLLLALAGCGGAKPDEETLTVFAAASLTDAFEELAAAFEAENPGVTIVANYGASSQLAAQLIEGAPADVFASANEAQMQAVLDAGRAVGPAESFTTNQLTVIVPADNPAGVERLADLARPGTALVLAAPGVPVREYTDAMIATLSNDPAFGPAFRDGVYTNLVSEEANVRQVAAKIALGEADAGIVYTSDVTPDIAGNVRQIAIPAAAQVVARYPIAVVDGTQLTELAREFIAFIRSPVGQAILQRWGFQGIQD